MVSYIFSSRLLFLSLITLLGGGCAPVSQSPITPPDSPSASPSHRRNATPTLADINRTLASVAMQGRASLSDYRIGAEDLLEITLFNVDGADGRITPRTVRMRVSQRGVITLPLLGDISVMGLTVAAVEQALRERYDKYIYNPQVGVLVKEYHQKVSIIGAVRSPGVYTITGPRTLIDLLAMAGGVTQGAGPQVHLYRRGPNERQSQVIDLLVLASNPGLYNDKNVNLPVQAGDVINVPAAGTFFIDGAVGRPGSYSIVRAYTVTQAIALAGGINEFLADYSGITIYRSRGRSKVEEISVNLNAIRAGETPDPQIEADDMIVVPVSAVKYIFDYVLRRVPFPSVVPSPLN